MPVLRTHMIRVYNYMASGLALSGIVAFALFSSPSLAALFFEVTPRGVAGLNILGWVAIFAPFGLLLLMGFRAQQMSVGGIQGDLLGGHCIDGASACRCCCSATPALRWRGPSS